ncbi:MAG TPA: peptide-methionine (S)-S-oxide reductase MsrA [Dokdonella sp.]|uniref:peptide-methionine (S)-S-oxide reductase MsrA n=1 Tax=Dokdonella sp. TaxID=2291710 RepID=UPI002D7F6614|nr:peptide-methionine (S)-S-oxide reductase MsrA [Dokdonella sp.]HET9031783.1 peptide-methionine (S)-S-oxide reductase MsrA [Dokdonella sp.]
MMFSRIRLLRHAASMGLLLSLFAMNACAGPAEDTSAPVAASAGTQSAIFAGGCFWCMEPPFDKLDGVISTTSGYTGGKLPNPSYEQVSAGRSGHAEAVKVIYDPARVSYQKLLDVFWHNVDPFAIDQQFCDHGDQYRTAIFTQGAEQMRLAEESKKALEGPGKFNKPIATQIVPASTFYPAEDYHQDYYKKNPVRYKFYRYNCGRDARLEQIWGSSGH